MEELWKNGTTLELTVIPADAVSADLDLVSFLQGRVFPAGSLYRKMQVAIRENIYQLYPPVTDRPPRLGEVAGIDYYFWTSSKISDNMFLERGELNGKVHYNTNGPERLNFVSSGTAET